MLPHTLHAAMTAQMAQARALWEHDRQQHQPGVEMPVRWMRFVLNHPAVMRWLLHDDRAERLAIESNGSRLWPTCLELAMREGVAMATLDDDLRRTMLQTGVALV